MDLSQQINATKGSPELYPHFVVDDALQPRRSQRVISSWRRRLLSLRFSFSHANKTTTTSHTNKNNCGTVVNSVPLCTFRLMSHESLCLPSTVTSLTVERKGRIRPCCCWISSIDKILSSNTIEHNDAPSSC